MGIFKTIIRTVAFPAIRPIEQFQEAAVKIREDLAEGKALREKHQAELAARAQQYAADSTEVTAAELQNPRLIKDPSKRFRVLADLRGWDATSLAEQLVAVRRGKRFALIAACVVLAMGFITIFAAKAWVVIVVCPGLLMVTAFGLANAFKYGLHQYQLESKALYGAKDYMSRPDFFSHLVW